MRKFLLYWGPPIAWMVIIFLLSSRQRVSVTESFLPDFVIFKSAHILEYGLLQFLVFRAVYSHTKRKFKSILIAAAISVSYAIIDEVHQTFVPTRNGQLLDIFIDSVGILSVSFFTNRHFSRVIKYL